MYGEQCRTRFSPRRWFFVADNMHALGSCHPKRQDGEHPCLECWQFLGRRLVKSCFWRVLERKSTLFQNQRCRCLNKRCGPRWCDWGRPIQRRSSFAGRGSALIIGCKLRRRYHWLHNKQIGYLHTYIPVGKVGRSFSWLAAILSSLCVKMMHSNTRWIGDSATKRIHLPLALFQEDQAYSAASSCPCLSQSSRFTRQTDRQHGFLCRPQYPRMLRAQCPRHSTRILVGSSDISHRSLIIAFFSLVSNRK
jgi:hypothetical protein